MDINEPCNIFSLYISSDWLGYSPLDLARQKKMQAIVRHVSHVLNGNEVNATSISSSRPLVPVFKKSTLQPKIVSSVGNNDKHKMSTEQYQSSAILQHQAIGIERPQNYSNEHNQFSCSERHHNMGIEHNENTGIGHNVYESSANQQVYTSGNEQNSHQIGDIENNMSAEKFDPNADSRFTSESNDSMDSQTVGKQHSITLAYSNKEAHSTDGVINTIDSQVSSQNKVNSATAVSLKKTQPLGSIPMFRNGMERCQHPNLNYDQQDETSICKDETWFEGCQTGENKTCSISSPKSLPPVASSRRKIDLHLNLKRKDSSRCPPDEKAFLSKIDSQLNPRQAVTELISTQNHNDQLNIINNNTKPIRSANTVLTENKLSMCNDNFGNSNDNNSIIKNNTNVISSPAALVPATSMLSQKRTLQKNLSPKNISKSQNINALLSPVHRHAHHRLLQRRQTGEREGTNGADILDSKGIISKYQNTDKFVDGGKSIHDQEDKEENESMFEEEIFLDSKLNSSQKLNNKDRQSNARKSSLSLPDLRDMTGCLVTSQITSPPADAFMMVEGQSNDLENEAFDANGKSPMHYFSKDDEDDVFDNDEDDSALYEDNRSDDYIEGNMADEIGNYTDLYRPVQCNGNEGTTLKDSSKSLPTIKAPTPRKSKSFISPKKNTVGKNVHSK